MRKRVLLIVIGIVVFLVGLCWYYYHDIETTIHRGTAYGFTIGDSKEMVFKQIATLFSKQRIRWVDIKYDDKRWKIEEVSDQFSEWNSWYLYGVGDADIHYIWLNFRSIHDETLSLKNMHGELYAGHDKKVFQSWPPAEKDVPCRLMVGMSYDEVYNALVELNRKDGYTQMRLRPQGYRKIMACSAAEFKRLVKRDIWDVDFYPTPLLYGSNYIRLHFQQDRLQTIQRRRHFSYPFLQPFIDILEYLLSGRSQ